MSSSSERFVLTYRKRSILYLASGTVFSFETLFVLYLFAGIYKGIPQLVWVPIDLTALLLLINVGVGLVVLLNRSFKITAKATKLVVTCLLFFAYAAISLIWSPSTTYGQEKALLTILVFFSFISTALIISYDPLRVHRFLIVLCLFAGWVAFEAFKIYLEFGGDRSIAALGTNYLGIGRVVGMALLIVLGYLLFFARRNLVKGLLLHRQRIINK